MGLPSLEEKKAVQSFETLTAGGQTIYLAQIKGTQAPPPQPSFGGFGQRERVVDGIRYGPSARYTSARMETWPGHRNAQSLFSHANRWSIAGSDGHPRRR